MKKDSLNKLIKITVEIVIVIVLVMSCFIYYNKFINKEKSAISTPVSTSDVSDNKISSLKKVVITDNNQIISIGNNNFKIKKEITIDGSYLLIDDDIQYISDMETAYADFAYVTNEFIFFTLIGQDGEIISYAIDKDGKKVTVNDNKYQMYDIKNVDGTLESIGHIFCGLDGDCPDKKLIIKYENNSVIVIPKNN